VRPLRISVEGFTCFKERQAVDFTAFDLFAISGPTGAGKTSVLDAMLFALYGKVPRVERYAELISLGSDRMSVMLDFRLGGKEYRVTRVGRRKGAADAQLADISMGGEVSLAGGVREVNDRVEKLLGLSFEAFTQSVVLPQGEFMKFMKSAPARRREILRDLLRLHIYERMREHASSKQKDLAREVETLQGLLEQEYAGATQEALDKLQVDEAALAESLLAVAGKLKDWQTALEDLKVRHRLTKELETRLSRSRQLALEEPRVLAQEQRLKAARRVAPVLNLLQTAIEAEQALSDAKRQQADASDALRRARGAHEEASLGLERAEKAASELPRLRERIGKLDEVKGQLKAREAAEKRLEKARAQQGELKAKLATARDDAKEAQARLKAREKDAAKVASALSGIGYDEARDEQLVTALMLANELVQKRDGAEQASEEAKRAEAKVAELSVATERAQEALALAKDRQKNAQQQVADREAEAKDARLRNAAALLRHGLSTSEPCPVCDQPVMKRPKAHAPRSGGLEEAEERLEQASADLAEARQAASDKQAKVDTARELLTGARAQAAEAKKKAGEAAKLVEKGERKLEATAGGLLGDGKGSLETRVLTAAESQREKKKLFDQANREREQTEKALEKARRDTEAAQERAGGLEERLTHQVEALSAIEAEIKALDAEIAKVTRHPDPKAEREQLAQRTEELEEARKAAQQAERDGKSAVSEAEARAKAADREVTQAGKGLDRAQERARAAVKDAGFADEQEAKAFALTSEALAQLEDEVRAWREERSSVDKRLAELQAELGGREVDDRTLKSAEDEAVELRQEQQKALSRHAGLQEQLQQLKRKVKAAKAHRKTLNGRVHELNTFKELAEELKSDRFQAFILRETIQEMVAGASERLWNLSSNRYRLEYKNESFDVIDYDNARERRSADTLSGGETFLASLSLALQLSEQVQRAAGSVVLDSLFIDEGFGTLDPETLDTATEAIESLPAGGRMVGIITHIPELTARMRGRLLVSKQGEGSRIKAELDS